MSIKSALTNYTAAVLRGLSCLCTRMTCVGRWGRKSPETDCGGCSWFSQHHSSEERRICEDWPACWPIVSARRHTEHYQSHVKCSCRHVLCNSTFVSTVTTRMEKLNYQGFWQWHIRDFTKNLGNVREQILSEKSGLKPFTVICIFAFILDFVEFVDFILVSDHTVLHCCPHHWQ